MLSCNGQGPLFLLTILELLFEPTLISDCPLSPSGKSHCSGSDQSSAGFNRDRNKKLESATHYLHVINHGKHTILLCTQWTWATFFNTFVVHSSIFRKVHHFTIWTYLLHILIALHHLPDRSNFGKMCPLSWTRQAADSSFKFSEMQIHIPDFLECLSLLKDYNQHLVNFLRPLFSLPQSCRSWRLPLLCVWWREAIHAKWWTQIT